MATTRGSYAQNAKRVYYLSMEFLTGRTFTNALLALELLRAPSSRRCARLRRRLRGAGRASSPTPALGNGGLGRLAACFLDSMATLGVPGMGYGIRYEYGMFRQRIVDGQQVEEPDYWLADGNPWEFQRPEVPTACASAAACSSRRAQRPWRCTGSTPRTCWPWPTTPSSRATALQATNTLRLWSAKATEEIDLSAFNRGNYMRRGGGARTIRRTSRACSTPTTPRHPAGAAAAPGILLRQRQRCRTCCAATCATTPTSTRCPTRSRIHLNDTHPALAVPELMRLLIDEHRLPWDTAWALRTRIFSLHQPHADARGAGDLAGRDVGPPPAAPPAASSSTSMRASWPSVHARFPGTTSSCCGGSR